MNYSRIALAGFGAFAVYFALGGLVFAAIPTLRNEFLKYPDIYRSPEAMKAVMPIGMAAMFLGMVVLAVLYALLYRGGSPSTRARALGPSSAFLRSAPLCCTTM